MKIKFNYRNLNSLLSFVLIVALIIDTMISNISDILSSQLNTYYGTILFVLLVAIIFGSAYYLLIYLKNTSAELRLRKPIINTIYNIMYKTQFILMTIVAIISIQVFFLSQY